jgi:hypothetical protein
MKKRKAHMNGIQKTSPLFLWFSALFRPLILLGLGKTLAAIFIKFFFYQLQTVIFPRTRPVVNVDHPLDNKVPFDPSWVGLYNTFTIFWMKSAGWLLKTFGPEIKKDVILFVNDMARLYNAAGDVYGKCQSTTTRPGVTANFNFIIIHMFDPHLHCIPSLHVMVCAYVGFKTTELIHKYSPDPERYREELMWVFKNSVEIIESVLLVKQHSVNCIPAGYFMIHALFEGFRGSWTDSYFSEMFKDDAKGIEDVSEVRQYMENLFEKFINDYAISGDENEVLLKFLDEYTGSLKKKDADADGVKVG